MCLAHDSQVRLRQIVVVITFVNYYEPPNIIIQRIPNESKSASYNIPHYLFSTTATNHFIEQKQIYAAK